MNGLARTTRRPPRTNHTNARARARACAMCCFLRALAQVPSEAQRSAAVRPVLDVCSCAAATLRVCVQTTKYGKGGQAYRCACAADRTGARSAAATAESSMAGTR